MIRFSDTFLKYALAASLLTETGGAVVFINKMMTAPDSNIAPAAAQDSKNAMEAAMYVTFAGAMGTALASNPLRSRGVLKR